MTLACTAPWRASARHNPSSNSFRIGLMLPEHCASRSLCVPLN
jgi:hypothetical protein